MRSLTNSIPLVLLLTSASALAAASMAPQTVMEKNEASRRLNDVQADAVLTVGKGDGSKKVKNFTWWKKLTSDGVHYNTMTRFHSPAEIRDEGILFLERDNGQADVLLYLPNFKKTRRIERQAQSGSFMGSDFSYADIATPHLSDFTYKSLKNESCPESPKPCYVIEATPKNEDVRERIGYSKQVYWIRPDNFMISKGEFYSVDGKLAKKLAASDTRKVDPKQGRWMSYKMRVDDVNQKSYTVLDFSNTQVNKGIQDSIFTKQSLERPN